MPRVAKNLGVAVTLLLLVAASVARAAADLSFNLTSFSTVPTGSPIPFSIDATVVNNGAVPVNLQAWGFKLLFSPTVPATDLKLVSFTNNVIPEPIGYRIDGGPLNPPLPQFVTANIVAQSFTGGVGTVLPPTSTTTLVRMNFELQAGAAANALYNLSFSANPQDTNFGADGDDGLPTSLGTGSISTPEPASGLAVLLAVSILAGGSRRRGAGVDVETAQLQSR